MGGWIGEGAVVVNGEEISTIIEFLQRWHTENRLPSWSGSRGGRSEE